MLRQRLSQSPVGQIELWYLSFLYQFRQIFWQILEGLTCIIFAEVTWIKNMYLVS